VRAADQLGSTVALVVVGHRSSADWLDRQARRGAVEGLDFARLVDREDDRMGARIDIEANDIL
jgi:hypothetical protein